MNFNEAIEALKEGKMVTREIWGGYWIMLEKPTVQAKQPAPSGFTRDLFIDTQDMVLAKLKTGGFAPAQPYWQDIFATDWKIYEHPF